MESEEYGEAIRFACIALLETIQKTGYDEMSENRALAINLSFVGVMCSIVYLLTRSRLHKIK